MQAISVTVHIATWKSEASRTRTPRLYPLATWQTPSAQERQGRVSRLLCAGGPQAKTVSARRRRIIGACKDALPSVRSALHVSPARLSKCKLQCKARWEAFRNLIKNRRSREAPSLVPFTAVGTSLRMVLRGLLGCLITLHVHGMSPMPGGDQDWKAPPGAWARRTCSTISVFGLLLGPMCSHVLDRSLHHTRSAPSLRYLTLAPHSCVHRPANVQPREPGRHADLVAAPFRLC